MESSMILTLVSSVWTSTSTLSELERESAGESMLEESSETSREFPLTRPSNGSPRRWLAPLYEHRILSFGMNEQSLSSKLDTDYNQH